MRTVRGRAIAETRWAEWGGGEGGRVAGESNDNERPHRIGRLNLPACVPRVLVSLSMLRLPGYLCRALALAGKGGLGARLPSPSTCAARAHVQCLGLL
jgi:hypothetical protein